MTDAEARGFHSLPPVAGHPVPVLPIPGGPKLPPHFIFMGPTPAPPTVPIVTYTPPPIYTLPPQLETAHGFNVPGSPVLVIPTLGGLGTGIYGGGGGGF